MQVRYKYNVYPDNPIATGLSRQIGALRTKKNIDGNGLVGIIIGAVVLLMSVGSGFDGRLFLMGLAGIGIGCFELKTYLNRKQKIIVLQHQLDDALCLHRAMATYIHKHEEEKNR